MFGPRDSIVTSLEKRDIVPFNFPILQWWKDSERRIARRLYNIQNTYVSLSQIFLSLFFVILDWKILVFPERRVHRKLLLLLTIAIIAIEWWNSQRERAFVARVIRRSIVAPPRENEDGPPLTENATPISAYYSRREQDYRYTTIGISAKTCR